MNRNRKKLTVSRKKAKILTVNRKSHYPIETLLQKQVTMIVEDLPQHEHQKKPDNRSGFIL